jgi:hypothetical protein
MFSIFVYFFFPPSSLPSSGHEKKLNKWSSHHFGLPPQWERDLRPTGMLHGID